MRNFDGNAKVGLRDKDTNRLVAVYPGYVDLHDRKTEDKVKFWYYQQSCSAEEELRNYYVDKLTDDEIAKFET